MFKQTISLTRDIIALPIVVVMTISMIVAYLLGGKIVRKVLKKAFLLSEDN